MNIAKIWTVIALVTILGMAYANQPILSIDALVAHEKTGRLLKRKLQQGALKQGQRLQVRVMLNRRVDAYRASLNTPDGRRALEDFISQTKSQFFKQPIPGKFILGSSYRMLPGFGASVDAKALTHLLNHPDVAEVDAMLRFTSNLGTSLAKTGDPESFAIAQIDPVHAMGYKGKDITVAIVDDGLDTQHPAFAGRILGGFDFGDNDADFSMDPQCPDQSHGTGVAGIAVGGGGDVTGVAPEANIVFYKVGVSDCEGFGDLVAAMDAAVADMDRFQTRIVNLSLGVDDMLYDNVAECEANAPAMLVQAFRNAADAGLLVFASAGNAANCDGIEFPACFPGVISVASVYGQDIGEDINCYPLKTCVTERNSSICDFEEAPYFGGIGETVPDEVTFYANTAQNLDLLAPAENARTAKPGGDIEPAFGGTSAAAPFAAGLTAALLSATDQKLSRQEILSLLQSTGVAKTDAKNMLTFKRVNGLQALEKLLEENFQSVKQLILPWVSNNEQFRSQIVMVNHSNNPASVRMSAKRADGSEATSEILEVMPRGMVIQTAQELFPSLGEGPGYSVIMEANNPAIEARWVTFDQETLTPSQEVAVAWNHSESIQTQVNNTLLFGYLPGADGFQSAPVIVNLGEIPTDITIYYFQQDGSLFATDRIDEAKPGQPVIPRFIDLAAGTVYAIAQGTQPLAGNVFVFNAMRQTAIGSAVGIEGFTQPE